MSLTFTKPLLMQNNACTERVSHIQHYSQVVAVYTTLQTICSLMVSMTGLPKAYSDGVAYPDVKEPQYSIAKKTILVFILNVLNYVTVSRAVCKVYLKVQ